MTREFQIRTTDEHGDEEVRCFTSLAEAQSAYEELLTSQPPYDLDLELIEVLSQDSLMADLGSPYLDAEEVEA